MIPSCCSVPLFLARLSRWCRLLLPGGVIVLAAALAPARARGFDFSPRQELVADEDAVRAETYFLRDDQTEVFAVVPPRWRLFGTPGALEMTRSELGSALVRVEVSPVTAGTGFDPKGLEVYRRVALTNRLTTADAKLRLVGENADVYPVYNWTSHEFVLTYEQFGQRLRRSVCFLNLDAKTQLIVTVVAPEPDFEQAARAGHSFVAGWHQVSTKPLLTRSAPQPPNHG